ncbi:MAG: T9SS type A sorting domain-containing protein [Patiriisocius sp.]|uniref:T9SS type A sorting domain-containing protein n=1 Tax=Patiriisocius sp. TaxID=2822396 RepID=UPI003EF0EAFC
MQNNEWTQIGQSLYGTEEYDFFGYAADINDDGSRIVVSSVRTNGPNLNPGYVKVFSLQNNQWTQVYQQLNGTSDSVEFGIGVRMDASGNKITIATSNTEGSLGGYVKVFEEQNNSWVQLGNNIIGENIEDSVANVIVTGQHAIDMTSDGETISFRAYNNSSSISYVKVVTLENNTWTQKGNSIIENIENASFGNSISIDNTGNIMAIGSPFNGSNLEGSVSIYNYTNNSWQKSIPNIDGDASVDRLGWYTAINRIGSTIAASAPFADTDLNASGYVKTFGLDPTLSIQNLTFSEDLKLFPNPNTGTFIIKFENVFSEINFTISNTLGQKIYSETFSNQNQIVFSKPLATGLYLATLDYNGTRRTLKFSVK